MRVSFSQAHAATELARIEDQHGSVKGAYEDLQSALDAVEDGQKIYLTEDITTTCRVCFDNALTLIIAGQPMIIGWPASPFRDENQETIGMLTGSLNANTEI